MFEFYEKYSTSFLIYPVWQAANLRLSLNFNKLQSFDICAQQNLQIDMKTHISLRCPYEAALGPWLPI